MRFDIPTLHTELKVSYVSIETLLHELLYCNLEKVLN